MHLDNMPIFFTIMIIAPLQAAIDPLASEFTVSEFVLTLLKDPSLETHPYSERC